MGLLDWFRHSTPELGDDGISASLVEETCTYLIKMTDSRLSLLPHCKQRLASPVLHTLRHIKTLRAELPGLHEAGPLAWSIDPAMRALFAQPADMLNTFKQCQKLQDYAAKASPLDPIYAVLAMDFEEQGRFGVGMQGQMMVRDVAQTALNFSHHKLRIFSRDEQGLWRAVARRMLDELALVALDHMQAEQAERHELEEHHLLLKARLATFTQRGAGADSFLGEAGEMLSSEESAVLLQKIEDNGAQLAALGASSATLDRQLDYLTEVLNAPAQFFQIERRHTVLDSMNVVVEAPQGEAIDFGVISFKRKPPVRRAFLPVRIDRALIGTGEGQGLNLDSAERFL